MVLPSGSTHPAHDDAASLCERALALRHRDPAAALELARRAADAAASQDADARTRRRALAVLGACLTPFPDDVLRAREVLRQALRACEDVGDDALRVEVLNELGDNLIATADHDPAARHLREAVDLARRLGVRAEEARALRLLGTACTQTGDFVQALSLLLEALAIHESGEGDAGRWERGMLFGRIAIVYSNMDQFQQSIAYYQTALECFADQYPRRAARMLYSMGVTARESKDFALAEQCFRRSLALHEEHGDDAGRALGQLGICMTLFSRGEVDEAEARIGPVLERMRDDPVLRAYYADALWAMSDIHVRRGRHARALECLESALPLYFELARPAAHRAELHKRFCEVLRALKRFEEALHHHELYHQLRVQHLEEQANARMSRMMVEFDTERAVKDREISRLRSVELEREIAERKEAEAALARAKAALEETNRELQALAVRDPLTGLFNRRHLDQRLAEAFALMRRYALPLSVMICDVDDFKRINDTFSHAVGDEVLRTVARLIRQHVRAVDVAARYGGEEFVVVFPATTLEQASAACEKLRGVVTGYPWETLCPGISVTLSAGVAALEGHADHEKLLHDADRRLYQAKRRGKNRVVA